MAAETPPNTIIIKTEHRAIDIKDWLPGADRRRPVDDNVDVVIAECPSLEVIVGDSISCDNLAVTSCPKLESIEPRLWVKGYITLDGLPRLIGLHRGIGHRHINIYNCPEIYHYHGLAKDRYYKLYHLAGYYHAGCRHFSREAALLHWGESSVSGSRERRARGRKFFNAIRKWS